MGAATLRRGRKEVLLPTRLPSVSGADHRRALTDLRREMGIEVLEAKKAGGYSQKYVDAAVAQARKVAEGNLAAWEKESDEAFAELQKNVDEQTARIAELEELIEALPDEEADEAGAADASSDESSGEATAETAPPEAHPTQEMNAEDAIAHLDALKTVEDVDAMKAAEIVGKNRKGVLAAIEKHIEWLNTPDD